MALKFPDATEHGGRSGKVWVLPQGVKELFEAGVFPDVEGLSFAESQGLPTIYRPAPAPGVAPERVAALADAVQPGGGGWTAPVPANGPGMGSGAMPAGMMAPPPPPPRP